MLPFALESSSYDKINHFLVKPLQFDQQDTYIATWDEIPRENHSREQHK
jgi:hypothetical protein